MAQETKTSDLDWVGEAAGRFSSWLLRDSGDRPEPPRRSPFANL